MEGGGRGISFDDSTVVRPDVSTTTVQYDSGTAAMLARDPRCIMILYDRPFAALHAAFLHGRMRPFSH